VTGSWGRAKAVEQVLPGGGNKAICDDGDAKHTADSKTKGENVSRQKEKKNSAMRRVSLVIVGEASFARKTTSFQSVRG